MKFLGTCEYPMDKSFWINSETSWLKAFKDLSKGGFVGSVIEHETHALFYSPTEQIDIEKDGIFYHFIKAGDPHNFIKKAQEINPDILFLNGYAECLDRVLAKTLTCKKILRLHSEPWLCFYHGNYEVLNNVDLVICPMSHQVKELREKFGYKGEIYWLNFGVDIERFYNKNLTRNIDFIASADSGRPAKGYPIIRDVFPILEKRGYKTLNATYLNKEDLSNILNRGKIFYFPSLTEASGSRIMIEAISCGLIPVVDSNGVTCRLVAELFDGYNIDSEPIVEKGLQFKAFNKKPELIADELENILKNDTKPRSNYRIINKFSLNYEVSELLWILKSFN